MFGLTSAIFSPIYSHVFDSQVEVFLLFFSVTLPIIAFSGFFFLAPIKATTEAVSETVEDTSYPSHLSDIDDGLSKENQKILNHYSHNPPKKEWAGVSIKQELNSVQIFSSFDFYLLFFVFMLSTGVGLTLFNNLGSLVLSMGGASASWLVTLLSLCNCGGRLLFGFSSDLLVRTPWISRSACLLSGLALMAAGELYFAGAITQTNIIWLVPGVIMLGLAYGSVMSLVPALVNEFLGTKYFGGNWGIVRASPAISGFVLSTMVAGRLYERFVVEGTDCYGWDCYGWSFLINCGVVLVSMGGCVGLMIRWHLFERSLKRAQSDLAKPLM